VFVMAISGIRRDSEKRRAERLGSATVSVAGRCVSRRPSPFSTIKEWLKDYSHGLVCAWTDGKDVFGETPTTAFETNVLP